jgi:DNA polymerase III epsilon subunit-like protein
MNLVFFDIECASVFKTIAKICAFGYVVCDEQFNIIQREDILINPKGKFHLTDGRGEHGLVLPYEYEDFKNYPKFPAVYPKIKQLLEDENNIVFGHSILNDIKYLDLETNRFKLPSFNFSFSDSQLMYMTAINDFSRQFGLEYITKDLNVEFTPHRAADDAYATMKIVEAMCKRYDMSVTQLEEHLQIKRGRIKRHQVTKPTSATFDEYCTQRELNKKDRAERRTKFFMFLSRKRVKKSGKLVGTTFNFSRNIEDEIELSIPLVTQIYEHGGRYTQKLTDCNMYVCRKGDETVRTHNAKQIEGLNVIDVDELKGMLDGQSS